MKKKNNGQTMKKSDLITQALKDAPKLSEEDIYQAVLTFVRKSFEKYFWINSRDINYNVVFDRTESTDKEVAQHILGYLKDSSFCQPKENIKDKNENDIVEADMIDMMDVRDIDDTSHGELGLYIGLTYFKLVSNDWIVESVKDFTQKDKKETK